jgi:hypothetical protein
VVVIRHGDREARLEAGGSFWITFPAGEMKTTMASLVDDRRDSFTVSNLAHSILTRARDLVSHSRRNPLPYRDSPFRNDTAETCYLSGDGRCTVASRSNKATRRASH